MEANDSVAIRICFALSCCLTCDNITSCCSALKEADAVEIELGEGAKVMAGKKELPPPPAAAQGQQVVASAAGSSLTSALEAAGLAKLVPAVDRAGIESKEELMRYTYASLATELREYGGAELTPAQERKLRALLGEDVEVTDEQAQV